MRVGSLDELLDSISLDVLLQSLPVLQLTVVQLYADWYIHFAACKQEHVAISIQIACSHMENGKEQSAIVMH